MDGEYWWPKTVTVTGQNQKKYCNSIQFSSDFYQKALRVLLFPALSDRSTVTLDCGKVTLRCAKWLKIDRKTV